MEIIYLLICFFASMVGAICGIGGGVIIKPVLDMFALDSVSTISFLSGCTVLSMSCYSVMKSIIRHEQMVQQDVGLPLALGASVGGIIGKQTFQLIKSASGNEHVVSLTQAICLGVITFGTLVYILKKDRIHTHKIHSRFVCIAIGLLLGILSSFLGIGGGPINLVVLYYFFSMDTKTAAANSLFIILLSQITSLVTTLLTNNVPTFQPLTLIVMVLGGIGGGIAGRALNKGLDNKAVDKLLILLMMAIVCICIHNGLTAM